MRYDSLTPTRNAMFALPSIKTLRRIPTNISPNIQPFANDRKVLFINVYHVCRGQKVKQLYSYNCSQVRKTSCFFSTKQDFSNEEQEEQRFYVNSFVDGPPLTFGFGKIAVQTDSSVVGAAGSTIVLATVAKDERFSSEKTASTLLTVGYRQRLASVGRIPVGNSRVDNTGRMTVDEVLASRAIDRAIRPLLLKNKSNVRYHVQCSVESCELWQDENIQNESFVAKNITYGNPVSTALNTAAAAMAEYLSEPVAATSLAIFSKGLVVQDAGPNTLFEATKHGEYELIGQLLFAGTRRDAVMIEWTAAPYSGPNGLPEHHWQDVLELAAASIQPRLDTIEELSSLKRSTSLKHAINQKGSTLGYDEKISNVREKLKLSPSQFSQSSPRSEPISLKFPSPDTVTDNLLPLIIRHCESLLSQSLALLFGYNDSTLSQKDETVKDLSTAFVHPFLDLLSKAERGLREHVIKQEIEHLIDQFLSSDNDGEITEYKLGWKLLSDDRKNEVMETVVDTLFRRALNSTAIKYGVRSDGRGLTKCDGWKTIRPVRLQVPVLPDNVHGSALFSRGETQVLCTVTLGPPSEGRRNLDPYRQTSNPKLPPEPNASTGQAYNDIPVGSLRFLRNQEALVSDLNTRKVKAEKEMTGDSGSLAEFETAFLQYDFPPHSTGSVPEGGSRMTADRRSIGHGALAERAILPVLPKKHSFPYTIRMTSDVTDSNGSSSMASVCGATLALLDAGVPIAAPVVGVSVGLAMDTNDNEATNQPYTLLLDITGTEDHFGSMDFKIAGTRDGVTSMQLDVKHVIPVRILVEAIFLARAGRIALLDEMDNMVQESLGGLKHRWSTKRSAPRVEIIRFDPRRKRDLIGPGGAVLRQIEDKYGVSLDLSQDGQCLLYGQNRDMVETAKQTIMELVSDVVVGEAYIGTVSEIKDFGVIVELLRNKEGLLHVSEMIADNNSNTLAEGNNAHSVLEYLKIGQKIEVLCIGVDPVQGSVKLSRKALVGR